MCCSSTTSLCLCVTPCVHLCVLFTLLSCRFVFPIAHVAEISIHPLLLSYRITIHTYYFPSSDCSNPIICVHLSRSASLIVASAQVIVGMMMIVMSSSPLLQDQISTYDCPCARQRGREPFASSISLLKLSSDLNMRICLPNPDYELHRS